MLNIVVVLGSVREGRRSESPAKLVVERVKQAGHTCEFVDFKEIPLPFYNSPTVPVVYYKKGYPNQMAQKWSDIARQADAFIIVSPEYNHGYPAVLKNALDWLYLEFEKKPFGLVGVSDGTTSGARMIENLRPVIQNYNAMSIRETVMVGPVDKYFDVEGKLLDESIIKRIDGLIASLTWWGETLKLARNKA